MIMKGYILNHLVHSISRLFVLYQGVHRSWNPSSCVLRENSQGTAFLLRSPASHRPCGRPWDAARKRSVISRWPPPPCLLPPASAFFNSHKQIIIPPRKCFPLKKKKKSDPGSGETWCHPDSHDGTFNDTIQSRVYLATIMPFSPLCGSVWEVINVCFHALCLSRWAGGRKALCGVNCWVVYFKAFSLL